MKKRISATVSSICPIPDIPATAGLTLLPNTVLVPLKVKKVVALAHRRIDNVEDRAARRPLERGHDSRRHVCHIDHRYVVAAIAGHLLRTR